MCFEPAVSLGTAIFEFSIVIVLLTLFRSSLMARFQAMFIFILGFYQFTEYMVCTSGSAALFATLGFAAYTFLPAIGFHFVAAYTKRKFPTVLLYVVPSIFTAIALLADPFTLEAACGTFTIVAKNIFFPPNGNALPLVIYLAYYFSFIAVAMTILYLSKKKYNRLFLISCFMAVLLSVLPPVILFVVLPSTGIVFPSVFCQFAIFYAIFALAAVYLERKKKK